MAGLVVGAGGGGLRAVRADEAEARGSRVVEMSVVGGGPEASRLFETVRELLARLEVTTTVANTSSPKCRRTSCSTSAARFVRVSAIVIKRPATASRGLSRLLTRLIDCRSCASPSSA